MEMSSYMIHEMIKKKKRRTRVIQLIYRIFFTAILRFLDGRVPFYMTLHAYFLRSLGMKVSDKPLYICADVKFDSSDFSLVSIGKNVVISSEVRILVHDYSVNKALEFANVNTLSEVRKLSPVTIEDNCFIGMRVLILPGVTIGENSIVGAGSVVAKSIPPNSVAIGNPARLVYPLEDYSKKVHNELLFAQQYFVRN